MSTVTDFPIAEMKWMLETLLSCCPVVKMVMWSRGGGLTWRSQIGANPYHSTPN